MQAISRRGKAIFDTKTSRPLPTRGQSVTETLDIMERTAAKDLEDHAEESASGS
jgi:hypothetical protein